MKPGIPPIRFFDLLKVLQVCWAMVFFGQANAQNSGSTSGLYFPPRDSPDWEQRPLAELDWDQTALAEFLAWLPTQDTRAFIILKDGKIVVEEYWGSKLTGVGEMDQNSYWYWESAGKTLTAALIGLAQSDKALHLSDRTQKYLGKGWTSMTSKQEKEIRLVHHLTFSTGIDDQVANPDDSSPASLQFLAKPGTRWSYHNATYSLVEKVLEKATGKDYQSYFKAKIGDPIGMKGLWQKSGLTHMFYSDARSFARFGLLMLAKGNWNGAQILPLDFFEKMTQTSQDMNPSYGYLTWLNGKSSFRVPGAKTEIAGSMVPEAPSDMVQAVGKNGQLIMIVPSQNLVIVRMGGWQGDAAVPYVLMREIWKRLGRVGD